MNLKVWNESIRNHFYIICIFKQSLSFYVLPFLRMGLSDWVLNSVIQKMWHSTVASCWTPMHIVWVSDSDYAGRYYLPGWRTCMSPWTFFLYSFLELPSAWQGNNVYQSLCRIRLGIKLITYRTINGATKTLLAVIFKRWNLLYHVFLLLFRVS